MKNYDVARKDIIDDLRELRDIYRNDIIFKWKMNSIIDNISRLDITENKENSLDCDFSMNVTKPCYYGKNIDLLTCIEKGLLEKESLKEFCRVNILKYVIRYDKKNGLEDLEKAKEYLNKLIEVTDEKR